MAYKKGTLAKRVSRVEAQQRRQRPEMKQSTFALVGSPASGAATVVNLCALTAGTAITNRIGNRIKVWRVEFRGIMDAGLDLHLVQAHTNDTPAITSFTTARGTFVESNQTNTKLTEWMHYAVPDSVAHNFSRTRKWRNGINVKYNGTSSTNGVDNVLYAVAVNRSTAAQSVDATVRVWWTDP